MYHFDEAAVTQHLDLRELDAAMVTAFADLGRGRAASTVRVRAQAEGSMSSAMAAAAPALGVTGGKVYATADGRFTFHVVLFDLDGALLCTMDGAALTAARTASLTAAAIDRLARPGARVAAILGAGRESHAHLQMLQRTFDLDEIRVWARRPDRAASVVADHATRSTRLVSVDDPAAAVDGADIVITATPSDTPLVDQHAIADRALVCAVGATKPQRCETDPGIFRRAAAVVTDSVAGAPDECGDLIHAVAAGTFHWDDLIDIADVLAGNVEVPRAGVAGPVVFETQGIALQDVVAAALVWRAASQGDGRRSA